MSGPVEADGHQWIQIAGPGLPPGSGCVTLPDPELTCPIWFGWSATGNAVNGDPWFELDPTHCPDPREDPGAFMMLGDVEALHCYGEGVIEFVGWVPGPEAIRDPRQSWECPVLDPDGPASWLFCPGGYSATVYANETEAVSIELFVDPRSGTQLTYPGKRVLVTGHLDDPQAADCAKAIPPGQPIHPASAVLECRARLVVTNLTGVGP